jgi:acetamidase/formamidase/AraC-like DNA-binding protein
MSHGWLDLEAYPRSGRTRVWNEALLPLEYASSGNSGDLSGKLHYIESSTGWLFADLYWSNQKLLSLPSPLSNPLWLMLVVEGEAKATIAGQSHSLRAGDVLYRSTSEIALEARDASVRFFCVRFPGSAWKSSRAGLMPVEAGVLEADTPLGPALCGLLSGMADRFIDMSADELRPLETAIDHLTALILRATLSSPTVGATNASRSAILSHVYQAIEARLDDPTLNQGMIALAQGLSNRYLQKLFQSTGKNFTQYVRRRRLERCCADLANPLYDSYSISQLCFRWGFNDAPHFSRVFREEYGMTPREFRRSAAALPDLAKIAAHVPRGAPGERARAQAQGTHRSVAEPAGGLYESALLEREAAPANDSASRPPSPAPSCEASERHHVLPATDKTVHWGFVSSQLPPALRIRSGDTVFIETLTHHANDDHDRMVRHDSAVENIYYWAKDGKKIDRRGAGPNDASVYGRGSGEGFGVHICTGPIYVEDAEPGDLLEIRILDVTPRMSANPTFAGQAFGSNVAAWWGFHYDDLLDEPKRREVVTIFEIEEHGDDSHIARALYSYRWTPQIDPFGVVHQTIDYPGLRVDHTTVTKNRTVLRDVRVPLRLHFGFLGVAPNTNNLVDSIPPGPFGGNLDNWRIGSGATVYLPVGVPGALLSVGDPHASQGDAELSGTAIECSLNGEFQIVLRKKDARAGFLQDLNYPLIETDDEWVIQGFSYPDYLATLGEQAQSEIYKKSSLDLAMRDAFRKTRRFLMQACSMSEDEAITFMSVAVDFGITQVVDGNWGVHAVIRRKLVESRTRRPPPEC